jgi:hypothetical protein
MSAQAEEEADSLNFRALGALLGFSKDGRADLAALLRSDAPLNWTVRNVLADAIEGSNFAGVSLRMEGHQDQSDRFHGMMVRRSWLAEGRAIAPIVQEAPDVQAGFLAAGQDTGKGDDLCRKRYYYAKNFEKWSKSAVAAGGFYSKLSTADLEDIWHLTSFDQKKRTGKDSTPKPLPADEYDAIIGDRVRFLRSLAGPNWSPESAERYVQVMMLYMHLLPPASG